MSSRRAPVDALETGGAHWLVWRRPGLWTTTLWGEPSPDEVAALVRVYDAAFEEEVRFVSLVDCGSLSQVDPAAFATLAGYMQQRKPDFERLLTRQALVRPEGLVGSVVMGFFVALEYRQPVEAFAAAAEALDWLLDGKGATDNNELAERLARVRGLQPLARQAQLLVEENPALELGVVAQALGCTPRTLQRQLRSAGASFVELRAAARVRRAQQLLADSDAEVTQIALEVGCASLQHLSRLFRRHTGMTPLAWRKSRRVAPSGQRLSRK